MTSKSGPQIKRKSVPLIGQSAESFQIGPLSPSLSDSLTNGTSIPAPAPPTPPPKEPSIMECPTTPPQQQQPRSTLSEATYNRFFPSDEPSPSHPPATSTTSPTIDSNDSPPPPQSSHPSSKLQKMGYEVSASASPSPYAASASSPSQRRPSGVFRLLPFKRRHDETRTSTSHDSISSIRPQTPGAESVMASLADGDSNPSLKKKKSGTFWGRRKSSLNYMVGAEDASMQQRQQRNGNGNGNGNPATSMRGQRAVSSGSAAGGGSEAVLEGGEEEEFPPRLKKKKSLTFWRRTSSLGLDRMASGAGSTAYGQPIRNASIEEKSAGTNGQASLLGEDTIMSEPERVETRPRSPPPVLPEVGVVVHDEGGLMGGEDWFGGIR
ncbi:MAG: hypothetical protein Q9204_002896 [Flavoplaca sp. TL-2023a]